MKLYLHPTTSVVDAAIAAYGADCHLAGPTGKVAILPGRSALQYSKALKIQALRRTLAPGEQSA